MSQLADTEERIDTATQKSLRDDLKKESVVKFFAHVSASNISPAEAIKILNEQAGSGWLASIARILGR